MERKDQIEQEMHKIQNFTTKNGLLDTTISKERIFDMYTTEEEKKKIPVSQYQVIMNSESLKSLNKQIEFAISNKKVVDILHEKMQDQKVRQQKILESEQSKNDQRMKDKKSGKTKERLVREKMQGYSD